MLAFRNIGATLMAACLLSVAANAAEESAAAPPAAQGAGPVTGLPLPRFVSLKFDKVHLRRGPGPHHRIDWDYVERRGMPVEIIAEADHWRRIRDIDGDEGWIHASQLSNLRGVIVTGKGIAVLRRRADPSAAPVALVEPGLIGEVRACRSGWCRVVIRGYRGWLPRAVLWGLYAHEEGID